MQVDVPFMCLPLQPLLSAPANVAPLEVKRDDLVPNLNSHTSTG